MKRPSQKILWILTIALIVLAAADVVLTTVGILFFNGEEGNPLLVWLAHLIPFVDDPGTQVVLTVWVSKITVLLGIIVAVHFAAESDPLRDDILMIMGLVSCILIYIGVVGSWIWLIASTFS